jgi:hypothetical protein
MVALKVGGLFCNGIKGIELSDAQQRLPVPAESARGGEKVRGGGRARRNGSGSSRAGGPDVPMSCLPAAETVGGNEL